MNNNREQLCPVWLSILLGFGAVLALVLVYPRASRSVADEFLVEPASVLSVAYLEAWLRAEPDSQEYLDSLAMQYLELGRWESALHVAQKLMLLADDDQMLRKAILYELVAAERILYALDTSDPGRPLAISRFVRILEDASRYPWNVDILRNLALKAQAVGADQIVTEFYTQLAVNDVVNAHRWHAKLGKVALSIEAYEAAASAFFSAYESAPTQAGKREYFLKALQALEASEDASRATWEGQQRLGELADDRMVLRHLLDLARRSGHTDLAARYARELVKVTMKPVASSYRFGFVRTFRVSAGAQPVEGAGAAALAELQTEHELIYSAFIESGELDDAEMVARRALEAGLDPAVWSQRLAQAAQWNNHPKVALTYWREYAQAVDDTQAWAKVLELAPQLDDDEAYLAAWERHHASRMKPPPDRLQGKRELLSTYMQLGHWESALRMVAQLEKAGDTFERQRLLVTELTALQQRAYEFTPDDSRRRHYFDRMKAALHRSLEYNWDIPTMSSLAQKAHEAGVIDIVVHYYQALAQTDQNKAAQWYERLGDVALGVGAYEHAAVAYFSAREAVADRDEQRRYFQAGVQAFVSGGDVQRACAEGAAQVGDLEDDPATLRYLINVARQAHRTDLMTRYARRLLKLTQNHQAPMHAVRLSERNLPSDTYFGKRPARFAYDASFAGAGPTPLYGSQFDASLVPANYGWPALPAPVRYADFRHGMDNVQTRYVAEQAIPASSPPIDVRAADYEVAYFAFLESQQLSEAEATAEQAIANGLPINVWAPRLAQVAQWNNHPAKALKYWLMYARSTGNEQAWSSVQELAFQLNDTSTYVTALMHAASRAPHDMALLDELIDGFEQLGDRRAAMNYLQAHARGTLRQPMLERYAALAARAGDDAAAMRAYRELTELDPANPLYAVQLAMFDYSDGNPQSALAILSRASEHIGHGANTVDFWRFYAELGRLAQRKDIEDVAYRRLLASGDVAPGDLRTMAAFYSEYPLDAGRLAEAEFRQTGATTALESALRYYTAARAWPRIELLLNDASAQRPNPFETHPSLRAARADYYLHVHRWDDALTDLRYAASGPHATDASRLAYLWALVNVGSSSELRSAVHRWRSLARVNADYVAVLGAAELRLGNPAVAARYLRRQRLQRADDPLWVLALASAEEAAGRTGQAWQLRRLAWRRIKKHEHGMAAAGLAPLPKQPHDNARISLSQQFANADYSRALLLQRLRQARTAAGSSSLQNGPLRKSPNTLSRSLVQTDAVSIPTSTEAGSKQHTLVDAATKEVALAWAMSTEQHALARAWLASLYADGLLRSADADVTLALAANDTSALSALLNDRERIMSADSRLAALSRVGKLDEAQTLAFDMADGAPESESRQQALAQMMVRDRPAVGVDVVHSATDPLTYTQITASGALKLTSQTGVAIELTDRIQRTTDSSVMAWAPSHDRQIQVTLRNTSANRDVALTIGARKAMESFAMARVEAQFNRQGSVRPIVSVGVNQPTFVTQYMQAGATQDAIELALNWTPQSRFFAYGGVKAYRFHAQDRTYLGKGFNVTAVGGYRLWLGYPNWNVRLVAVRGVYSASDNEAPSMRALLPAGVAPAASIFMPDSFTQYGVMVGFGSNDKDTYTPRWRPFLDAGYIHDSNQGWGPVINTGIGGPVIGSDHLRLFYLYAKAPQGQGQSVTQLGISYRLFF